MNARRADERVWLSLGDVEASSDGHGRVEFRLKGSTTVLLHLNRAAVEKLQGLFAAEPARGTPLVELWASPQPELPPAPPGPWTPAKRYDEAEPNCTRCGEAVRQDLYAPNYDTRTDTETRDGKPVRVLRHTHVDCDDARGLRYHNLPRG